MQTPSRPPHAGDALLRVIEVRVAKVVLLKLIIDKLKQQLLRRVRAQFGPSSEQLDDPQIALIEGVARTRTKSHSRERVPSRWTRGSFRRKDLGLITTRPWTKTKRSACFRYEAPQQELGRHATPSACRCLRRRCAGSRQSSLPRGIRGAGQARTGSPSLCIRRSIVAREELPSRQLRGAAVPPQRRARSRGRR